MMKTTLKKINCKIKKLIVNMITITTTRRAQTSKMIVPFTSAATNPKHFSNTVSGWSSMVPFIANCFVIDSIL